MIVDDVNRDELLALERGLATRDPAGLDRPLADLVADDFLEFGASGRVHGAADVRADLANGPRPVTISNFAAVELADGVVLATYQSVDPRLVNRCSIWLRREGRWVMRFHQGTVAG